MPEPEVFIDGSRVEFSGTPPAGLEALLASVASVLGESGRLVSGVVVADIGPVQELSDAQYAAARRIDLSTITIDEAVDRLAQGCGDRLDAVAAAADRLASAVLRCGWSESREQCVGLASELGGVVQDLGGLIQAGPGGRELARMLEEFVPLLDRWVDAVHASDAARVCLGLHREVLPALHRLSDQIRSMCSKEEA